MGEDNKNKDKNNKNKDKNNKNKDKNNKNKDTQSRKWLLTINNPLEHGFPHDIIKDRLGEFKSIIYFCISDEVGHDGTFHTHFYFVFASAVRFSTIKKRFPPANIAMANGTSIQNRDYVFKIGKWEKDKKKETNISESHEEFGDVPAERQGARNDLSDLYDMIKSGMSNYDILEDSPQYMLNIDKIERARQILKEEQYRKIFRELDVTYVFGVTGSGKTRNVMEKYGYENVFRVTDYEHPFDSYKCQDVVIFEEFRSSLKIQDMLNFLDGYPLELPCRYANKTACFTKIYIISNVDFVEQYISIQRDYPETWLALVRRIPHIRQYVGNGVVNDYLTKDYIRSNLFGTVVSDDYNPFLKIVK